MMEENIIKILEVVADFDEEITLESNLKNDLEFDSLKYIDLTVKVKKLINKDISAFELSKLETVGDLIGYVKKIQG